jgi:hypothetical protein
LLACALLLGSESPVAQRPPAALVGFSYSPKLTTWLGREPAADLSTLLEKTNPDLVRLPVYWDLTQASPSVLDFTVTDELLSVVADHNKTSARSTRVILTIGARNFVYPELHTPSWAGPREQPEIDLAQSNAAYRRYFDGTLLRYRSSPLLYAWQVENEAFDYVVNEDTGDDQITPQQVAWEIAEVHRLDPRHRAVTTTFDGWSVLVDWLQLNMEPVLDGLHGFPSGHPGDSLAAGDVLGLDIYVDGPSTPFRFATVALRTSWKAEAIDYWAGLAKQQGKQVWLTEMQAQPWATDPGGFSTADLVESAQAYRTTPVQVVLLWGVETWLEDPAWMAAAESAMAVLRSP